MTTRRILAVVLAAGLAAPRILAAKDFSWEPVEVEQAQQIIAAFDEIEMIRFDNVLRHYAQDAFGLPHIILAAGAVGSGRSVAELLAVYDDMLELQPDPGYAGAASLAAAAAMSGKTPEEIKAFFRDIHFIQNGGDAKGWAVLTAAAFLSGRLHADVHRHRQLYEALPLTDIAATFLAAGGMISGKSPEQMKAMLSSISPQGNTRGAVSILALAAAVSDKSPNEIKQLFVKISQMEGTPRLPIAKAALTSAAAISAKYRQAAQAAELTRRLQFRPSPVVDGETAQEYFKFNWDGTQAP